MAMPHATAGWTADKIRALTDDGKRYEVIDGELFVTSAPSWPHQRAIAKLLVRLDSYLRDHPIADVLVAPADIEYAADKLVQPDLFVVPLVAGRKPRRWEDVGCLLLAVEVVSPATARADRQVKRRLYQQQGVPEYWIVDMDARLVERWRPDDERGELLAQELRWHPDPALPPLLIELPRLFAEAWGEE